MASLPSHAIAALGFGAFFYKPDIPKRIWIVGALCSVIPDIDVIGFRFGIRYGDFWGHRGFTHSLVFAAVLASAVVLVGFRGQLSNISRLSIWTYFFLATASHSLLDAMTDGGLGVAFFAPFDNHRYFLPWTPIRVPRSDSDDFSRVGGMLLFGANFCGFGFPRECWSFRPCCYAHAVPRVTPDSTGHDSTHVRLIPIGRS
jgi:inner membrane protein